MSVESGNSSQNTASKRSRWTRMFALDLFISGLPLRRYAAPVTGCLYNPSLALLVWRIPAELLVSGLCWQPEEATSVKESAATGQMSLPAVKAFKASRQRARLPLHLPFVGAAYIQGAYSHPKFSNQENSSQECPAEGLSVDSRSSHVNKDQLSYPCLFNSYEELSNCPKITRL